MIKRCVDCKHFVLSYEMLEMDIVGNITDEGKDNHCGVSGAGNLWTFPFQNTKCKLYEAKEATDGKN